MTQSSLRFETAILYPAIVALPETELSVAVAQLLEGSTASSAIESDREFWSRQSPEGQAHKASCIVVQDQGQIVGIVTERDLLRVSIQHNAWKELALGQIMSHPVVTLPLTDFADDKTAQDLFDHHEINHLPVVDVEGVLLGIATQDCLHQIRDNHQLRASHQSYSEVVASAPVGLFRHDASGDCVMVNPRCLELCGLTFEQAMGNQWQAALHPEDRESVLTLWLNVVEAGQSFKHEYRFLHSDGQVKWVYTQATPEKNAQGQVIGYCGTMIDISDRKQAEEALRESEARIRSITDSIPGCVVYVDSSQRLQFINQTYETWFNAPKEQLLGRHIKACLGAKHYSQCKAKLEQVLAGETVTYDTEITNAQGNHRYWSATLVPDLDPQQQVRGYYALITDITDRQLAEQALAVSEAKNRAFLATIPDYLFCVDAQGRYREVVNYRHGITIFPPHFDPVGRSMNDVLSAAMAERQMHYLQKALSTGKLQTFEQVVPQGDHSRHEEVRVIQIDGDEVLFMVRDITERKNTEQQLQNLLAGTAAETGKNFFPVLTRHLTEALQVDHAFVAELLSDDGELNSLAFWSDGALQPAFCYRVGGTLCEFVLNDGKYQCDDLAAHFGDDVPDFVEMMGATSYLGIALHNSEGAAIGVLWVMHRYPFQDTQLVEDIMRVFAARAAAELERQRARFSLEQLNQELEHKVEERTAELRDRKQFLQTVLDAFPLSVFWKDLNSVYLGCNQRFLWDAGLQSTSEVIGKTDYDLVWGATEADVYRADDQAVIASNTAKLDIIEPQLQANGNHILVETNKMPLRNADGEVLGVVGTYHDVTVRQEAEERLRQLSERLDLAVSSAHIGIWEWDIEQDRLIWDQRMYELYSLSSEQKSLNFDFWNSCLHPDDQAVAKKNFQLASQGQSNYDTEFRIVGPDNSIRFIKANAVFQWDKQGNPRRMTGINYDITTQKIAEAQLYKTNQELARATRSKDEFLANMSHELRTPLNAILGMNEGLKEQVFGELNERQMDALDVVCRSGSHLLELINDVLDLAKIEAGQVTLNNDYMPISGLVESSIAFVKQQAAKKRIHLEAKVPSDFPLLYMDVRRMRQVLVNLLANAVKFTSEQGRICLDVSRVTAGPGESPDSQSGEMLQISICDTGIGIAAENLAQLFEPFLQIDSALNRQYEGTGLGLALVKCIVELHGGQVTVTSELGVGSCFTVKLPWLVAENQPAVITSSSVAASLQSSSPQGEGVISILLAEDNDANIQTLTTYLNAKDYRVLLAKTGQQAVDLAHSEQPDVVLMDIQMPDMDGLEAIRHIRRLPPLADLPIIALTALAMTGDRERCLQAGANEYLSKPVKLQQLVETIQQFVAAK